MQTTKMEPMTILLYGILELLRENTVLQKYVPLERLIIERHLVNSNTHACTCCKARSF